MAQGEVLRRWFEEHVLPTDSTGSTGSTGTAPIPSSAATSSRRGASDRVQQHVRSSATDLLMIAQELLALVPGGASGAL